VEQVVIIYITDDGRMGSVSYGHTKERCSQAKLLSDKLYQRAYEHLEDYHDLGEIDRKVSALLAHRNELAKMIKDAMPAMAERLEYIKRNPPIIGDFREIETIEYWLIRAREIVAELGV